MALALAGKQTIAWAAPPKCPAGLEPVSVTIGEDAAGLGLEIAQVDWTASGAPRREALASLHASRLNKRLCPVVVVARDIDDEDRVRSGVGMAGTVSAAPGPAVPTHPTPSGSSPSDAGPGRVDGGGGPAVPVNGGAVGPAGGSPCEPDEGGSRGGSGGGSPGSGCAACAFAGPADGRR